MSKTQTSSKVSKTTILDENTVINRGLSFILSPDSSLVIEAGAKIWGHLVTKLQIIKNFNFTDVPLKFDKQTDDFYVESLPFSIEDIILGDAHFWD